jgi:hypothetical protein
MPAVGLVLLIIGLWVVIRTLRGKLADSISRNTEYGL